MKPAQNSFSGVKYGAVSIKPTVKHADVGTYEDGANMGQLGVTIDREQSK